MNRGSIQRVIMADGFGTRLCPTPPPGYPKQALVLGGDKACSELGDAMVHVGPHYFSHTEVETLLAYPSKAKRGWEPTTTFEELVREMVQSDCTSALRDEVVKKAGFQAFSFRECARASLPADTTEAPCPCT